MLPGLLVSLLSGLPERRGPGETWNHLLPSWLRYALHTDPPTQIGGQGEI